MSRFKSSQVKENYWETEESNQKPLKWKTFGCSNARVIDDNANMMFMMMKLSNSRKSSKTRENAAIISIICTFPFNDSSLIFYQFLALFSFSFFLTSSLYFDICLHFDFWLFLPKFDCFQRCRVIKCEDNSVFHQNKSTFWCICTWNV